MQSDSTKYISLGETYIKFDLEFTEKNKILIKEVYLQQVGYISRVFLKNREAYKITIEYDKGSTKSKIVIWGTAIYLAIGNYGSFRSGIREIISDIKSFSSYVIDKMDDGPQINPDTILNAQRRTGLPGRLEDVYRKIENLERNLQGLSNVQIQTELSNIKQEVSNLIEILPAQDGQYFIESLDNQYTQNLPNPSERKTNYLHNRYALTPEDEVEVLEE